MIRDLKASSEFRLHSLDNETIQAFRSKDSAQSCTSGLIQMHFRPLREEAGKRKRELCAVRGAQSLGQASGRCTGINPKISTQPVQIDWGDEESQLSSVGTTVSSHTATNRHPQSQSQWGEKDFWSPMDWKSHSHPSTVVPNL